MITALELTNFKGISATQRIELAPLTLLFGANSAGKSTILQALQYAHHLLRRSNPSADRLALGGDAVDLGGFRAFVHDHDTFRTVVIRVAFELPVSLNIFRLPVPPQLDAVVTGGAEAAWVELHVEHQHGADDLDAAITSLRVGLGRDRECIASGSWQTGERGVVRARVRLSHAMVALAGPFGETAQGIDAVARREIDGEGQEWLVADLATARISALLDLDRPASLRNTEHHAGGAREAEGAFLVETLATLLLVGVPALALLELERAVYIGPARTVPSRSFAAERAPRVGRWADGSAAWDSIAFGPPHHRRRLNAALATIGVPYRVCSLRGFGSSIADTGDGDFIGVSAPTGRVAALLTATDTVLFPGDVGIGVSQIVPVVAACVLQPGGMVIVEQPELHVHPAWQVGLADVFVRAVGEGSPGRMVIAETHSEHLILRVLRRIREHAEQEPGTGSPAFTASQLSILHVEATAEGTLIRRQHVDDDGELTEPWPGGFFEERAKELF